LLASNGRAEREHERLLPFYHPPQAVQFTANTSPSDLLNAHPWLSSTRLVVKPDVLMGQRGKHDLIGLNLDFEQARPPTWKLAGLPCHAVMPSWGCLGELHPLSSCHVLR
jgi:succinyl-CoA synthetase beta subunit